nr:MAG TPA: hypothetical protein [Caudoviricetes sp.]
MTNHTYYIQQIVTCVNKFFIVDFYKFFVTK